MGLCRTVTSQLKRDFLCDTLEGYCSSVELAVCLALRMEMGEIENKNRNLYDSLAKVRSQVVAYSGGVDPAYLADATHRGLCERR